MPLPFITSTLLTLAIVQRCAFPQSSTLGRDVASFRSENHEEATHLFEAEDFRDDLTILESEGKPLWDRKATL
ncbi:hypothetical protein ACC684_38885, partial [Rhizobium ruizarguesonis]